MTTLLISDLHLESGRPDATMAMHRFLRGTADGCDRLFILGDLFDAWLGDDDDSLLAAEVGESLRTLVRNGSRLYIMHGNRDFLLGEDFCRQCGAELIYEPYSLPTVAGSVLLLHGDILCTDDEDYMAFRRTVREPGWQKKFLARPLSERREFARRARAESKAATAGKPDEIMDVNNDEVRRVLEESGHRVMIHGHTHRPADHGLFLKDGESARRIVLGDWGERIWYAAIDGRGDIRLISQSVSRI